jgi:hypothetical protein
MVMIGDENGDNSISVSTFFTKANANPNPGKIDRWFASEQLPKNQSSKIDALGYCLTVLCPCGQVDKRYSCPKGGGLPQKRELGGSQVRGIIRGQPYLTIPYISQGFQNYLELHGCDEYPAKEYIR